MPAEPRCYVAAAAVVSGWPAYALARLVTRHCRESIADLPPHLRAPIEEALDALRLAGDVWVSGRGSGQNKQSEAAIPSRNDALSAAEAADRLGVTPRRVRQLAEQGRLAGRKCADRWTFTTAAVADYARRRVSDDEP